MTTVQLPSNEPSLTTDFPLNTELVVHGAEGPIVIRTLDDALAYIQLRPEGDRSGNRDGVIRRLQSHSEAEKSQAGDAFRAWLDATGLLIEAREAR